MVRKNPDTKFKRKRSGCLTCRDRHIKCDEQKPVCNNCIRSNRKCLSGIRLNFTQYTFANPLNDIPNKILKELKSNSNLEKFRFLDHSITVASIYNGKDKYNSYLHLHSSEELKESDMQFENDTYYSQTLNQQLQKTSTKFIMSQSEFHQNPINSDLRSQIVGGSHHSNMPFNNIQPDADSNQYEFFNYMGFLQPNYINQQHSHFLQPQQHITSSSNDQSQLQAQVHQQQNFLNFHQNNSSIFQQLRFSPPIQNLHNLQQQQQQQHQLQPYHEFHQQQHMINPPKQTGSTSQLYTSNQLNSDTFPSTTLSQIPTSNDLQMLINSLEQEEIYWFLDLFNDQRVFQNLIPTICFKNSIHQNLLIPSLMSCSKFKDINLLALTNLQTTHWNQIPKSDFKQVESNLDLFQNLTISIVLILFGIYIKYNKFIVKGHLRFVLHSQLNLFELILDKLEHHLNSYSSFDLLSNEFKVIIQSVTILKFFMNKSFDFAFEEDRQQKLGLQQQQFPHLQNDQLDLSNFNILNKYETTLLNVSYYESNNLYSMESQKLKHLTWHLIKLDCIKTNPINQIFTNMNTYPIDKSLPNLENLQQYQLKSQPQIIIRTILQNFYLKLININNTQNLQFIQHLNLKLNWFFNNLNQFYDNNEINEDDDGNNNEIMIFYWHKFFEWTERYISS